MKDLIKILKLTLIILIPLLIIYFSLTYFFQPEPKQSCEDMNFVLGLKYDSCFDTKTKSLIFSVGKYSNNKVNSAVKVAMPGLETALEKIPEFGQKEFYKYSLQEIPSSITVKQYLRKLNTVCSNEDMIFIEPCKEEEIPPSVNFHNIGSSNVSIPVKNQTPSDLLPSNLVKPNSTFKINCRSDWICSDWGQCINGVQKRECVDNNFCLVSTNVQETEKTCAGCQEKWQCSWSQCENNISTPTCTDQNNCGTIFSKPNPIKCSEDCQPDISCTEWSECKANYTFTNLKDANQVSGLRTRICKDNNGCSKEEFQSESCSIKTSIDSREVIICGEKYIEMYSSATGELVGRIKNDYSGQELPDIALSLDSSEIKCDSCKNGIKDSNETGVDCGGKCPQCKKQAYKEDFLANILDEIRELF